MKKSIFAAAAALMLTAVSASAQMLTISEVYGGGGNAGSTYSNDFIELYNFGTTTIDMSSLAVFYASATNTTGYTTTNSTLLTGSLAAGAYYLIAEAAGTGGTTPLTNVNVAGTIAISGTTGKVALGLASTLPTYAAGAVTAANNPTVIDFIGFGPTANQYRGTGPAPIISNTTSDSRLTLTAPTSNATDYAAGPPSPQGTGTMTVGIPEPATYAYVIAGLGALTLGMRRRVA